MARKNLRPLSILWEGKTSRGDRRRLHDRCCGLPVSQKLVQNAIQVWNLSQKDFENETVFARDTMTLGYFGNRRGQFGDFVEVTGKGPNPYKGCHGVAQFPGVQFQSIAGQNTGFFQA